MHRVTLIPGDGVGPEVVNAALKVLEAAGVSIDFEVMKAGEIAMKEVGTPLPEEVLQSIKKNKIALKGPITTPIGSGFRSVNVGIRQALSLYANVRPARSFEGVRSRFENVDLIIIRENTEDLYSGLEHYYEEKEMAERLRIITKKASKRIVKFAFEYAVKEGRKKVAAVHKANILKATCGLFLDTARNIAKDYPQIEFKDYLVDNMAMQLVKNPEIFDVIVTTNLFGDILSDLCAGLVGGLGMVPSANIGDGIAVFEPVHGSAPKYAGLNKINPTAMILSSVMMVKYVGEKDAAMKIENALKKVLKEGKFLTYDIGGSASTTEMVEEIIRKIK